MMLRTLLALYGIVVTAATPIPKGTELSIRLESVVSSNDSKAKEAVKARVITPVIVGDSIALPAGTLVLGTVLAAKPTLSADERGLLHLSFSRLQIGDSVIPIEAVVIDVDNARESVDEAGRVVGILASETLAAKMAQGIGKVAEKNSALGDILAAASSAVFQQKPTGEIRYEPGIELKLKLLQPLVAAATQSQELKPISDEAELYRIVNSQPFRTQAEKPPKPSDLTNLMFIGTEEQLQAAFKSAGWSSAHALNRQSALETMRAIAEMRGYKEAPMSRLLLDGRRSDFDFQKGNNTFAKRHHLRVWRRPETYLDKPVWVSSSTHDIGIEFSQENRTFIHVIDPEIDRERGKVVSDLLFTGKVESLGLVERPGVPRDASNATGDKLITDGRMAVVILH